jgi:hypothetical protein
MDNMVYRRCESVREELAAVHGGKLVGKQFWKDRPSAGCGEARYLGHLTTNLQAPNHESTTTSLSHAFPSKINPQFSESHKVLLVPFLSISPAPQHTQPPKKTYPSLN